MEKKRFNSALIRHRRKEKKMTQTELGQRIGVSFRQIHQIENGITGTVSYRLPLLAEALDLELEQLYTSN